MKRFAVWLAAVLLLCTAMPVAAVPYTEHELEGYMQAIYCEQVWAHDFPEFQVQFIDVDLDGRKELITMEAGEEYAPKDARVYAFMDAELSGRGRLTVGKLEVCRDPDTHESFVINRVEKDGHIFHQRLVYNPERVSISLQGLTDDYASRLEDYGYSPVVVTKADYDTIKAYEDCHAIFQSAYQNTIYTNGEPPIVEPTDIDSASTYADSEAGVDLTPLWVAAGLVVAAGVVTTVAVCIVRRSTKRR